MGMREMWMRAKRERTEWASAILDGSTRVKSDNGGLTRDDIALTAAAVGSLFEADGITVDADALELVADPPVHRALGRYAALFFQYRQEILQCLRQIRPPLDACWAPTALPATSTPR